MARIDIDAGEAVFGLLICQQFIVEQQRRLALEFAGYLDEGQEAEADRIRERIALADSLRLKLLNVPIPYDTEDQT